MNYKLLKVFHQHVPDGDDVTDAAEEDEEVEDAVHITLLVESIEDSTRDIGDALGDEPDDGSCGDGVHQRLESHQYAQTHTDETEGFNVWMFFQFDETDGSTYDGTCPNEDKENPPPVKWKVKSEEWIIGSRISEGDEC